MNDVESHLRDSGEWFAPIATDSGGHARPSDSPAWWPTYYAQWLDAHSQGRDEKRLDPGGWTRDERGRDWWVTTTPEWDREWFQRRGVQPPERFGDKSKTFWQYSSPNLGQLKYDSGGWLTPSRLVGSVGLFFLALSILGLALAFGAEPNLIGVAIGAGLLPAAICGAGYAMVRAIESNDAR